MTRPVLTPEAASIFTRARVLGRAGPAGAEMLDPWEPDACPLASGPADARVDPGDATAFPGLQAAINALAAAARRDGRGGRRRISIAPGLYGEHVILPRLETAGGPLSFSLVAEGPGVHLRADIDAGMSGTEYAARFGAGFEGADPAIRAEFERIAARPMLGTVNAAVLRILGDGAELGGLTIENSYNEDRAEAAAAEQQVRINAQGQMSLGQHQAVAVIVSGADRVRMEGCRLLGDQDTLYLKTDVPVRTIRAFLRDCHIEGDIDFIFGGATAWFERCEIRSKGGRTDMAFVAAPSTHLGTPFGFVFHDCDFTHDGSPAALAGQFSLGRQWFEGARCTPYGTPPIPGYACHIGAVSQFDTPPEGTISPETLHSVGKVVILHSRIGAHIHPTAPWFAWNGGRHLPDDSYEPADWKPRFRPVQYGVADFRRLLGDWAAAEGMVFDLPDPQIPWVGEYGNIRA